MPVVLLCTTEDSQILLKGLISSFTSPIGLRVIHHADILMDIQKAAKFCGKFGCEVDVLVQNDFAGNAVVGNHMGGVE